jgi:hypothetical protein
LIDDHWWLSPLGETTRDGNDREAAGWNVRDDGGGLIVDIGEDYWWSDKRRRFRLCLAEALAKSPR